MCQAQADSNNQMTNESAESAVWQDPPWGWKIMYLQCSFQKPPPACDYDTWNVASATEEPVV